MTSNSKRIKDYLVASGIQSVEIEKLLTEDMSDQMEYIPFSADGFDYAIHHFLDSSDIPGYGVFQTNAILGLEGTEQFAIALVEGDDVICLDKKDGSVNLWLIQTGNGERIRIAPSFRAFLALSTKAMD